jgi:hypothetical protein
MHLQVRTFSIARHLHIAQEFFDLRRAAVPCWNHSLRPVALALNTDVHLSQQPAHGPQNEQTHLSIVNRPVPCPPRYTPSQYRTPPIFPTCSSSITSALALILLFFSSKGLTYEAFRINLEAC